MPYKEYNLLYINEDKTNLNSFEKDFYRKFNITTTKSFKDALGILTKNDIHLIIFDCQLAKTSGLEFLEEVKKKYPDIKCILLTDYDGIKILEDSFDSINLWRYILKPYDSAQLIVDIENALETYQLKIDKDKLLNKLEFRKGKYQKMMDTAMDSIVTINDKHEITEVNIAACELFGYSQKELIGGPLSMLIPENKRKAHPKLVKSFSNSEQKTKRMGNEDSYRYGLTSSGEKIPIEVSLSKQITEEGNFYSAFIRDVSNRLKREERIKESEYKLRKAQQIAKIGHWDLDIQNNILTWSEEVYRIFEIETKERELTNEFFLKNVHPDDSEMVNLAYTDSLKTTKPYSVNHRIQLQDGRIKHVHETCITKYNEYGKPIYSSGTVQDITTQIEAGTALKKSEKKFRTFTESLKVAVLVVRDEKICYVNIECEILFEYTKDELLDMDFTKNIHTDYISLINNNYNKRLKDEIFDNQYDIKIITKSSKIKDVTISAVKIDYQGRPSILVSFLDITAKKDVEERLKENALLLSKAQSMAHLGNWQWDIATNTVTWSNELYNIYGLRKDTFNASFEGYIERVHPEDKDCVKAIIQRALRNKKVVHFEERIVRPDKTLRYLSSWGSVITDKDHNPIKMLGACLDITEQRNKEKELLEITNELEKSLRILADKNNELEQFAYITSHDLQEPLRSITSFAELLDLQYRGKLGDDADTFISFILKSTKRMRDLIHGLLEYSILGKERTAEKVDCNEILKLVLEDLQEVISAKEGSIESESLPTLNAYPIELKQLFENLIGNALKYSREGVPPIINISSRKQDDIWEFKFKDNGIGINEKFYKKIFVIFKRLHSNEDYDGTGIGLAHCRKIIELHNGHIWVESIPNKGSEFYFTIRM